MKMRVDHFESIKRACTPLDTAELRERYRAAGLSDTRYRFDIFYASRWMRGHDFEAPESSGQRGNIGAVYAYLDDSHIETALKRIIPSLNEESTI